MLFKGFFMAQGSRLQSDKLMGSASMPSPKSVAIMYLKVTRDLDYYDTFNLID